MWMPISGHGSNHQGYNNRPINLYNRQDCSRTPTAQATGLKDGKRQFHSNPRNWRLQFLRSAWDCQHHTDQPATFTPPHMEWNVRGSHRTHRKLPLIENTSFNQDQIKTNCVEEFPYLLWRTKRLRRRPNHHNEGNFDPGTSLPIRSQETLPVDLVNTMVDHVFWGSKDTHHLSHYGINKCLSLKTCTCLFCNSGALDNRAPEWSQNKVEWCCREPIAGLALLIC